MEHQLGSELNRLPITDLKTKLIAFFNFIGLKNRMGVILDLPVHSKSSPLLLHLSWIGCKYLCTD